MELITFNPTDKVLLKKGKGINSHLERSLCDNVFVVRQADPDSHVEGQQWLSLDYLDGRPVPFLKISNSLVSPA